MHNLLNPDGPWQTRGTGDGPHTRLYLVARGFNGRPAGPVA